MRRRPMTPGRKNLLCVDPELASWRSCVHAQTYSTINTADDTEEEKQCDVQSVEWEGVRM